MNKLRNKLNPHQTDVSESLIRRRGQICPTKEMAYIGYIFAFYATKMGSSDSGETNVDPHWVQDPPWSFNGPYRAPEIDGPGHL